jgi:hypothetical protein
MRLILLGGRIMALMGRVVGVGAAGDPGGDIVMAVMVVRILFSVSICLSKIKTPPWAGASWRATKRRRCTIDGSIEAISSKSSDKIRHVGEERRG